MLRTHLESIDLDITIRSLNEAIKNKKSFTPYFKTLEKVVELEIGQAEIDKLSESYPSNELKPPFIWDKIHHNGDTWLTLAVRFGNIDFVRILLTKTKFIDTPNAHSQTALDIAVKNQDEKMTALLLEKNARSFDRDNFFATLSELPKDKMNNFIYLFERNKIDLDLNGKGGLSLLNHAIINNNLTLIIDLFRKNPSFNMVPHIKTAFENGWTKHENWKDLLLLLKDKIDLLILAFAEKNQFETFDNLCKLRQKDDNITFEFKKPLYKDFHDRQFKKDQQGNIFDDLYRCYEESTKTFVKFLKDNGQEINIKDINNNSLKDCAWHEQIYAKLKYVKLLVSLGFKYSAEEVIKFLPKEGSQDEPWLYLMIEQRFSLLTVLPESDNNTLLMRFTVNSNNMNYLSDLIDRYTSSEIKDDRTIWNHKNNNKETILDLIFKQSIMHPEKFLKMIEQLFSQGATEFRPYLLIEALNKLPSDDYRVDLLLLLKKFNLCIDSTLISLMEHSIINTKNYDIHIFIPMLHKSEIQLFDLWYLRIYHRQLPLFFKLNYNKFDDALKQFIPSINDEYFGRRSESEFIQFIAEDKNGKFKIQFNRIKNIERFLSPLFRFHESADVLNLRDSDGHLLKDFAKQKAISNCDQEVMELLMKNKVTFTKEEMRKIKKEKSCCNRLFSFFGMSYENDVKDVKDEKSMVRKKDR